MTAASLNSLQTRVVGGMDRGHSTEPLVVYGWRKTITEMWCFVCVSGPQTLPAHRPPLMPIKGREGGTNLDCIDFLGSFPLAVSAMFDCF